MEKNKADHIAYARLNPTETKLLQKIMEIEGMSKSAAIRYVIRYTARYAYSLLPAVGCPHCHSQKIEPTADDLIACEECGQEFGK